MTDTEMLERYRANFGLSEGDVTVEQARFHLSFEREMTAELMASSPADRWDTFERCYTRLYGEMPWLAGTGGRPEIDLWKALIGSTGTVVFEVGSGAGVLATMLAKDGYSVTATDISRNRGDREPVQNLQWETTDGVHLDRFTQPSSYNAVFSDQVIEHLHPDDVEEHLRTARRLLRAGGRYIMHTPHALTGPHDISRVFGFDEPVGMHLHEYTNLELTRLARRAGFSRVSSVLFSPGLTARPFVSRLHLVYLLAVETVLMRLPRHQARRIARALRGPLRLDVFLVADR